MSDQELLHHIKQLKIYEERDGLYLCVTDIAPDIRGLLFKPTTMEGSIVIETPEGAWECCRKGVLELGTTVWLYMRPDIEEVYREDARSQLEKDLAYAMQIGTLTWYNQYDGSIRHEDS
jgi:hypothetical protein